MKHIFVVHSQITYLAALAIICEEKMVDDDYLLIGFKSFNYTLPVNIVTTRGQKIWGGRMGVASDVDRVVNHFIGNDSFIAYFSVVDKLDRLLLTHEKCLDCNLFEEGFVSYRKYYTLNDLSIECNGYPKRLRKFGDYIKVLKHYLSLMFKGITPRVNALPFLYVSYITPDRKFYCLSDDTFPLALKRVPISLNNIVGRFSFTPSINIDNTYIWCSNSTYDHFKDKRICYVDYLKESVLPYLKNLKIKELQIKYHPRESVQSRIIFKDLCEKNGIKTVDIQDDIFMEVELIYAKNVTMLGEISSLLYYNALLGHRSISFYNIQKDAFWKIPDSESNYFFNKIELI